MRHNGIATIFLLCAPVLHAQTARPVALTRAQNQLASPSFTPDRAALATWLPTLHLAPLVRATPLDTTVDQNGRGGNVWHWLGVSAVVGALVGAVYVRSAHSADDWLQSHTSIGATVGALAGSLLGGLAYMIVHGPAQPLPAALPGEARQPASAGQVHE